MITRVLTLVALVLASQPSRATTFIEYSFSGVMTVVSPELAPTIVSGSQFSVQVLIDAGSPDTDPSPSVGRYRGWSAIIDVGSLTFTENPSTMGVAQVQDAGGTATESDYFLVAKAILGPSVNGQTPIGFSADFVDGTATMFSSDALPLSLGLSQLSQVANFVISFDGSEGHGEVLSLSVSLVPEPSSVILMLLGSCAIFRCTRRVA